MQDRLDNHLRVVTVRDPAIDREATDVDRYATHRDIDEVTFLPGQLPYTFVLRPLTPGEYATCDAMPGPTHATNSAFSLAVVRIENWDGPNAYVPGGDQTIVRKGRRVGIWSEDELREVATRLGGSTIEEIGTVALQRYNAGNLWSGSEPYTLPRSSRLGLGSIAFLLAERQKDNDSGERSGKPARNTDQPSG